MVRYIVAVCIADHLTHRKGKREFDLLGFQSPLAGGSVMRFNGMTVGELSQQTGLTIRTLHYYDEIGLLKPSLRTEAGYRVYTAGDLGRLQQVLLLRELGFSLAEIRQCLDGQDFSPMEVIRLYIAGLQEHIELQKGLCASLEMTAAHLDTAGQINAEEFLRAIAAMIEMEKYRTFEQQEYLERHREHPREECA